MAKTLTTTLLGFPVAVLNNPETLDEAVSACGGGDVGAAKIVSKFVGFCNAHHSYSDARADIVAAVEKVTGKTPKTDASGEVDEKDSVFVARALAESGKSVTDILAEIEVKDEQGNVVSTGVTSIEVDFNAGGSGRARGGAKVPGKTYIANAENLIKATDVAVLKNIVAGLEKLNPTATKATFTEDGKPTVESLAALFKANSDRKNAEKKAEEQAELAALGVSQPTA